MLPYIAAPWIRHANGDRTVQQKNINLFNLYLIWSIYFKYDLSVSIYLGIIFMDTLSENGVYHRIRWVECLGWNGTAKKHGRMARSWWKQMKKKSGNVGMSGMWNLKSGISGMSMNFSNKKRDGDYHQHSQNMSKYVKMLEKWSIYHKLNSKLPVNKTSVNPWLPHWPFRVKFSRRACQELGIENKVLSTREIGCALKKSLNHGSLNVPIEHHPSMNGIWSIMATFSGDVQYTQNGTVTNPR